VLVEHHGERAGVARHAAPLERGNVLLLLLVVAAVDVVVQVAHEPHDLRRRRSRRGGEARSIGRNTRSVIS